MALFGVWVVYMKLAGGEVVVRSLGVLNVRRAEDI
jgi:hypothetical protein